jgi:hypothetical protein
MMPTIHRTGDNGTLEHAFTGALGAWLASRPGPEDEVVLVSDDENPTPRRARIRNDGTILWAEPELPGMPEVDEPVVDDGIQYDPETGGLPIVRAPRGGVRFLTPLQEVSGEGYARTPPTATGNTMTWSDVEPPAAYEPTDPPDYDTTTRSVIQSALEAIESELDLISARMALDNDRRTMLRRSHAYHQRALNQFPAPPEAAD